jgi:signal recognition particle subunit SRP54
MFENLTNKFEEIFSSLKKAPSLNEKQVEEGLRNIRQALLEADVALPVAKELIKNIKPKAIGQEIIRSTTPGQMIVKIVYDELVQLLGDKKSDLNHNSCKISTISSKEQKKESFTGKFRYLSTCCTRAT